MTAIDAAGPASVPAVSPAGAGSHGNLGSCRFLGSEGAFFRLLLRGAVLLMVTLGIYRFWLATDVRRFLWGNTEIAGDRLDYTGTARELLLGFLMAIALLIPVYLAFFIAALDAGLVGSLSSVLGFAILALLGQFAVYRARRYRLTRTVYRGVRLYQTGSAWRYAISAVLWWTLTALTAGLAYPFGQASLERYKLRHTHYGNLSGRFEGSGIGLFFRGLLMWLIVVGPFVAGVAAATATVDWVALAAAVGGGSSANMWNRIEATNSEFAVAVMLALSGIGWAVTMAALLYPVFRAMMLRWWTNGVRLGEMAAKSHLRTGQIYGVYLRFIGFALLFAMGAGIVSGIALAIFGALSETLGKSNAG